jgi:hypothetical protein
VHTRSETLAGRNFASLRGRTRIVLGGDSDASKAGYARR